MHSICAGGDDGDDGDDDAFKNKNKTTRRGKLGWKKDMSPACFESRQASLVVR
ncbi:MAG: hypothetical protein ABGY24_15675 [bacterium]